MNVFDLTASIKLDKSEYDSSLDSASKQTASFGSKLSSGLGTAMKYGTVAVGAFATATTALTGSFVKGTNEVATYGDNVDKMSQKMGLSAEAYQEWDAIMQHSGASIDSMQRGMMTLSKQVESGSDAFQKLGLSQEEVASMSQEELFAKTIEGLQNMEAGTERNVLAQELLGGSAKELGALLNTSAEETENMRQRVHELGGVMSDDAVKASANFKDNLQDMQTAMSGVKRGINAEFLPAMSDLMKGFTDILAGGDGGEAIEKGMDELSKAFENATDKISQISETIIPKIVEVIAENLPEIFEMAGSILLSLGEGLIENLPLITESAIAVITQITGTIIQNLPTILASGIEVIIAIVQGITQAIPQLIPAITASIPVLVDTLLAHLPELIQAGVELLVAVGNGLINAIPQLVGNVPTIISNLVSTFMGLIPQLLSTGIQLIVGLGRGLIQAIPQLVSNVPQIISAIVNGLTSGISQIVSVGGQLIAGLWNGISDKMGWIKDKILGFGGKIVGWVKGIFGIASPSKVFAEIGGFMAEGLGVGWDNEMGDVKKAIESDMDFSGNMDYSVSGDMPQAQLAGIGDIVIPVYLSNRRIEEIVVSAEQISNYRSGGRG